MTRANKHNSNRHEAVVGGQRCKFDSMAEHRYAEWLERERKAGRISGWEFHPEPVPLLNNGHKVVGRLEPDFAIRKGGWVVAYHEVKGLATALWRWKRRHYSSLEPHVIPYVVIDAGRGVCATGEGEPALFDERPRRKRRVRVAADGGSRPRRKRRKK